MLKCEVQSFVISMMWCTCPWTTMKALKHSKNMRDTKWSNFSINICLVIHGQVIFGPIIGNSICDNFLICHVLSSAPIFSSLMFNSLNFGPQKKKNPKKNLKLEFMPCCSSQNMGPSSSLGFQIHQGWNTLNTKSGNAT